MSRPLRIFLCYASEDKPAVSELYTSLNSVDWLDPWLDNANILPGQNWRIMIEQAVEEADVVIVCLSDQSVTKDGYVHKEIRYAYDIALEKPEGTIFLIPLRLDNNCKIPRVLDNLQWVNYFGADKGYAYANLLNALKLRHAELNGIEGKKEGKPVGKSVQLPEEKKGFASSKLSRSILIGGILLAVLAAAFQGINYLSQKRSASSTPTVSIETVTATEVVSSTPTEQPTAIDTPIPLTLTPVFDIGSTQVSQKDGMTLLYVPEGKFLMGSDDSDSDEVPLHNVGLDAFWIDQTEVTTDMYMLCVHAEGCKKPNDVSHYVNPKYFNHPVVFVTWEDAAAYCSWAGRRLPTEAEWEKAARGTSGSIYPWGDEAPDKTLLNYNDNIGDTTRVGKYPEGASVYGALDMAGNVWEWVKDWYGEIYYRHAPSTNPLGPDTGTARVLRGGMWASDGYFIHSSDRAKAGATFANFYIGFRCAKSP